MDLKHYLNFKLFKIIKENVYIILLNSGVAGVVVQWVGIQWVGTHHPV